MRQVKQPTELDLLKIYVEEMQTKGENHKLVRMNVDDAMATRIGSKLGIEVTLEQVQSLAKKCLANEWLEHTVMEGGKYWRLSLTQNGIGVVRSQQRKEEIMAKRSLLKRASDYIEDHKGLFLVIGAIIGFATFLAKLLTD